MTNSIVYRFFQITVVGKAGLITTHDKIRSRVAEPGVAPEFSAHVLTKVSFEVTHPSIMTGVIIVSVTQEDVEVMIVVDTKSHRLWYPCRGLGWLSYRQM